MIAGNSFVGVWITGAYGNTGNVVQGNAIGLSPSAAALPNGRGVQLGTGASGNTIGGTAAGAGNAIAYNSNDGVVVLDTSAGNSILGNAIHSNGGLGIDLADDGVTANDVLDADAAPNLRRTSRS